MVASFGVQKWFQRRDAGTLCLRKYAFTIFQEIPYFAVLTRSVFLRVSGFLWPRGRPSLLQSIYPEQNNKVTFHFNKSTICNSLMDLSGHWLHVSASQNYHDCHCLMIISNLFCFCFCFCLWYVKRAKHGSDWTPIWNQRLQLFEWCSAVHLVALAAVSAWEDDDHIESDCEKMMI